jgi:hypothetical protein
MNRPEISDEIQKIMLQFIHLSISIDLKGLKSLLTQVASYELTPFRSPLAPLFKGGIGQKVPLFKGGIGQKVPLFKGGIGQKVPLKRGI